jgi:hypothetical protein
MKPALETIALLLVPDDREVVLGDLEEQEQPFWRGLFAILGFAARQQAECWRGWRPWAVTAWVIPGTLLLLGASFRLSMDARGLWQNGHADNALIYPAVLITAWAWTGGFMLGSLSRRTGWISPLLFTLPCLSCLLTFREPSLSSLSLLLFVPPGFLGFVLGRRWIRMDLVTSLAVALATTATMYMWQGMPAASWLLLLPGLYLAWTSSGGNQFKEA